MELLKELLGQELKRLGFRKRGTSYHRTTDGGLYLVVAVQGSAWDDSKYLNFGYADESLAKAGWIPESGCQVRFRLNAVIGVTDQMLTLLEMDPSDRPGPEVGQLFDLIRPLLVVEDWQDVRGLVGNQISAKRLFVHRDVQALVRGGQRDV
jgi:hypothetical protein